MDPRKQQAFLASGGSEVNVVPLDGFTSKRALLAPPSSIVTGQNVWIINSELRPRYRAINIGSRVTNTFGVTTNPAASAGTVCLGAFPYYFLPFADPIPISATSNSFHWLEAVGGSPAWSQLSYTSSTGSSIPPSIGTSNDWFAATVYSASRDSNILVISGMTNGAPGLYAAGGRYASGGAVTKYLSHLTGSPAAVDVAVFSNRVVAWHCAYLDGTVVPQRVQWSVAGDPEDWTGVGSGFEDLVDITGVGTRVFVNNDQIILASDREIWRGRAVGLPYVFQFTPIDRTLGIPYRRAAIQTTDGIFWLGTDYSIFRMVGEQIAPIGNQEIIDYLRAFLVNPEVAFFTYNQKLRHLRLWYAAAGSTYPNESITLNLTNNTWTREKYGTHSFQRGLSHRFERIWKTSAAVAPTAFPYDELIVSSAGSVAAFLQQATNSNASDMGDAVEERATFGQLLQTDPRNRKIIDEIRLDVGGYTTAPGAPANGASSAFSFGINVGESTSYETQLTLGSAALNLSNTSQIIDYPRFQTNYAQMTIRSTGGRWTLSHFYARIRDIGDVL